METEKLSCNSCGAPLTVPVAAKYVTCKHCSTQLAIQRTSDVSYTEQLNQLVDRTEELSEQLQTLTIQNELAALEREWESTRNKLMVSNKDGVSHVPTRGGAIGSGVVACVIGVIWLVVTSTVISGAGIPSPFNLFPLFGIVFMCIGAGASVSAYNKAIAYENAEERYRRDKAELTSRRD